MNIEKRVKEIMSKIFHVSELSIKNDSRMNELMGWDSLGHMNLITSLEQEFNIALSDDDVSQMISVELILDILKNYL